MLPTWNNTEGGSLSFKFRTNEPTGMMFYNGGDSQSKVDQTKISSMNLLTNHTLLLTIRATSSRWR